MTHRWFIAKMFFDLVPLPLPAEVRPDGDFLMVVPDLRPEVLYLNLPGSLVFKACDGRRTVKDVVVAYMAEQLRADRDNAAYEVVKTLRHLEQRMAILLATPEAAANFAAA